jgi:hypothetical protein
MNSESPPRCPRCNSSKIDSAIIGRRKVWYYDECQESFVEAKA